MEGIQKVQKTAHPNTIKLYSNENDSFSFDIVQLYHFITQNDKLNKEITIGGKRGVFVIDKYTFRNIIHAYTKLVEFPPWSNHLIDEHYHNGTPVPVFAHKSNIKGFWTVKKEFCDNNCFLNYDSSFGNKPINYVVDVFNRLYTNKYKPTHMKLKLIKGTNTLYHLDNDHTTSTNYQILPVPNAGICHWGGNYKITNDPHLVDGAKSIINMGSKIIKVYIGNKFVENYGGKSDWSFFKHQRKPKSLLDLIKLEPYQKVLQLPFETIVLVAFSMFSNDDDYWKKTNMSLDHISNEENEFKELAMYLNQNFPHKKFILQNWESDNAVFLEGDIPENKSHNYIFSLLTNLKILIESRKNGIDRAQNGKVKNVFSAIEINMVRIAQEKGLFRIVNTILPHIPIDYVSYSCYDSINADTLSKKPFLDCVEYIREQTKEHRNPPKIYIGEWGLPLKKVENSIAKVVVDNALQSFIESQIEFHLYWQIYDNEDIGFYLIEPNGNFSLVKKEIFY